MFEQNKESITDTICNSSTTILTVLISFGAFVATGVPVEIGKSK